VDPKPFQPVRTGTFYVANATSASSPAALPDSVEQVVLYNSSSTAIAYWACQGLTTSADTGPTAVVPTTTNPGVGDMPIPPSAQIRLSVGYGPKKFSVIASAADGNLYITPGRGN
jgi:hypothetical protein